MQVRVLLVVAVLHLQAHPIQAYYFLLQLFILGMGPNVHCVALVALSIEQTLIILNYLLHCFFLLLETVTICIEGELPALVVALFASLACNSSVIVWLAFRYDFELVDYFKSLSFEFAFIFLLYGFLPLLVLFSSVL